jgi:hypothetical protein
MTGIRLRFTLAAPIPLDRPVSPELYDVQGEAKRLTTVPVRFSSELSPDKPGASGECDWPEDVTVDEIVGRELGVSNICQTSDVLLNRGDYIMCLVNSGIRLRVELELGEDQPELCGNSQAFNPKHMRTGTVLIKSKEPDHK